MLCQQCYKSTEIEKYYYLERRKLSILLRSSKWKYEGKRVGLCMLIEIHMKKRQSKSKVGYFSEISFLVKAFRRSFNISLYALRRSSAFLLA